METAIKTEGTMIIPCPKCHGRGVIDGYRHILNGVCFACDGTGTKTVAANHKPSKLYSIYIVADFNDDGHQFRGCVFGQKARTPAEAKRKAIKTLQRGCFVDSIDTIEVETAR